jgi:hypothetical protein
MSKILSNEYLELLSGVDLFQTTDWLTDQEAHQLIKELIKLRKLTKDKVTERKKCTNHLKAG